MIHSKQDYLAQLKHSLGNHSDRQDILQEFELHLSELLAEIHAAEGLDEPKAMAIAVERLGTPSEVASLYGAELDVTPEKTQWTFIGVNLSFFIGGIVLTLLYHHVPLRAVDQLWAFLTSIPFAIMVMYMGFWALVGYEIGKEFGLGGKRLLSTTFYIGLIPNILLMALVVFRIVPSHWFDPLLSPGFILACILGTLLLYPISYAGYRWGTIRSV